MELLHQRHEAIHIGAVVVDVRHGDILIRHADLYVVCRQQLLVAHAVPFQAHECGGMIRPGIAVSLASADRQLLTVFLQLAHICLKALVMALPDRFVASFAMHKAGFIQLIKLRVGGQHFGQIFRHILLVGFHTQTVPAELLVDFVQQSRDFCKQPVRTMRWIGHTLFQRFAEVLG